MPEFPDLTDLDKIGKEAIFFKHSNDSQPLILCYIYITCKQPFLE